MELVGAGQRSVKSPNRYTYRQRLGLTLCDKITDVEDGSSRAELLALETHGLLHTENLGVVQSGLVKVLKSSTYGQGSVSYTPSNLLPETYWVNKKRGRMNQSIFLKMVLFCSGVYDD